MFPKVGFGSVLFVLNWVLWSLSLTVWGKSSYLHFNFSYVHISWTLILNVAKQENFPTGNNTITKKHPLKKLFHSVTQMSMQSEGITHSSKMHHLETMNVWRRILSNPFTSQREKWLKLQLIAIKTPIKFSLFWKFSNKLTKICAKSEPGKRLKPWKKQDKQDNM